MALTLHQLLPLLKAKGMAVSGAKPFMYISKAMPGAKDDAAVVYGRLKEVRRKVRADNLSVYTRRNYTLTLQQAWQQIPELHQSYFERDHNTIKERLARMATRLVKASNQKQAMMKLKASGGGD
eukprot:jgi/Chrzof1/7986/UNPLg00037.t1